MFRIDKSFTFEASHRLPNHDGKCANHHGHSYSVVLVCEGEELHTSGPKEGMLVDYTDISQVFKPVVAKYLDHQHLNDSLQMNAPTAELIAMWIYYKIKPLLPLLAEVQLKETASSVAIYRPANNLE